MKIIFGLVFHRADGEEYGVIREATPPFPDNLLDDEVLAEDSCGNYFVHRRDRVYFWDHETAELEFLAENLNDFQAGCQADTDIQLDSDDVISVWVDPEFAKEFGIKPKL